MNPSDKRFWTVIVIVAVILIAFGLWRHAAAPSQNQAVGDADVATTTPAQSDPTYTYMCDAGKSVTATLHLPKDDFANVHTSGGASIILAHGISADGARYVNPDESFVFWTKGDTAFVMENGTTTYSGCVTTGPLQ